MVELDYEHNIYYTHYMEKDLMCQDIFQVESL